MSGKPGTRKTTAQMTSENTSHDPWYHYAYDDPGSWRMLAVFRDTDSVPKEAFVPHMAGMNGLGSSSKLDEVICRNKDANTAWATSCDGTLEERIYQCQNWRGDVVARIKLNGAATEQAEQARASAYGVPFGEPPADIDADGDVDSADVTQITTWSNSATYEVRGDLNLDNNVNGTDVTLATGHSGTTLGYGKLSRPGVRSRQGYGGYETSFFNDSVLHVRHRVLKADLGRWLSRDPLGYVDGANLYEYGTSNPVATMDSMGTLCVGVCGGLSQIAGLQVAGLIEVEQPPVQQMNPCTNEGAPCRRSRTDCWVTLILVRYNPDECNIFSDQAFIAIQNKFCVGRTDPRLNLVRTWGDSEGCFGDESLCGCTNLGNPISAGFHRLGPREFCVTVAGCTFCGTAYGYSWWIEYDGLCHPMMDPDDPSFDPVDPPFPDIGPNDLPGKN